MNKICTKNIKLLMAPGNASGQCHWEMPVGMPVGMVVGQYKLDQGTYLCWTHLDNFCMIMVHIGPYWTILDQCGPLWTIWIVLDHSGPFWTILDLV